MSFLPSSHILCISPITWTSNQKNLSLSPPALHSVARATAAILPCPICLGYTSQAGHKCGMTVREGKQIGRDRERDRESQRKRRGRLTKTKKIHRLALQGKWLNEKAGLAFLAQPCLYPLSPFWHMLIQHWSTCSSRIRSLDHLNILCIYTMLLQHLNLINIKMFFYKTCCQPKFSDCHLNLNQELCQNKIQSKLCNILI